LESLLGSANHLAYPVRSRISPPKRINGFPGPGSWPIVPHSGGPGQWCGERRANNPMPFALLVLLLVLAVVVLLLGLFFVVKRWL
jgi:hypothetical protein